jgi:hypothetical protein
MEKELGIAPTATNDTIADLWAQMERAEDVAVFSALCEEAVRVGIVKGRGDVGGHPPFTGPLDGGSDF